MLLAVFAFFQRKQQHASLEISQVPDYVIRELSAEMKQQKGEAYEIVSVERTFGNDREYRFRITTDKQRGLVIMRDDPPGHAEFVRSEWYRSDL